MPNEPSFKDQLAIVVKDYLAQKITSEVALQRVTQLSRRYPLANTGELLFWYAVDRETGNES